MNENKNLNRVIFLNFNIFLLSIFTTIIFFSNQDIVKASTNDISISGVEVVEKSDTANISSQPTYSGMNINFAIKFYNLNDYVRYKIKVTNKGNEDILISDKGTINTSPDDYINYSFGWNSDDTNIVKANSTKEFYLNVKYNKEVDSNSYNPEGKYIQNRIISIKLDSQVSNNPTSDTDNKKNNIPPSQSMHDSKIDLIQTNPKTGDEIGKYFIMAICSFIGIVIVVITLKKKQLKINIEKYLHLLKNHPQKYVIALFIFSILTIVAIASYTYALESVEIKINSNIEIEKSRLAKSCYANSYKDGFCIDWNNYVDYSKYEQDTSNLIIKTSKEMPDTYEFEENSNYKLDKTYDVSEQQNNQVILGVYYNEAKEALLVIGATGGVNAPIDSSFLFASGCSDDDIERPPVNYSNRKPTSKLLGGISKTGIAYQKYICEKNSKTKENIMGIMNSMELNNLNVSDTVDMALMFGDNGEYSDKLTINLNNWDTSKVKNMSGMFSELAIDTKNVQLDLSNWNTSNVEDMSFMFGDNNALKYAKDYENNMNSRIMINRSNWSIGDLSKWDTSKVKNMAFMFACAGASAETWDIGNLENWNTSNVTNMTGMFINAGDYSGIWNLGNLSKWDTSKVTDMTGMFADAGSAAENWSIGDLSKWDTSKVTDMSGMFAYAGASAETWDIGNLENWNTSNVTNMTGMFINAGDYSGIWNLGNLSKWDTSKVTDMTGMFADAGSAAENWSIGDLSKWDTSKVTDMSEMFEGAGSAAENWSVGDLSKWDTSKVEYMNAMFESAGKSATNWNIGDLSKWDISKVVSTSYMFKNACYSATSCSIGDISKWNTSKVENMAAMFKEYGTALKEVELDLSKWDTSNVVDMRFMFSALAPNSQKTILKLNNFTFDKIKKEPDYFNETGFDNLFTKLPANTVIYVKSSKEQKWILDLTKSNRPASWNESNIIVQN